MLPFPEAGQLKSGSRERQPNESFTGNAGLAFAKFFDCWPNLDTPNGFSGPGAPEKSDFLDRFAQLKTMPNGAPVARRIKKLAEALGGSVIDYVSADPFVTGMGLPHPVENGFQWHHTYGVPYLPGSSLKGVLKAWATQWDAADPEDVARLLGEPDSAGSLISFDAFPTGSVKVYTEVITPHTSDWRVALADPPRTNAPGDWVSPVPIPFLAVEPGTTFQFAFAHRPKSATAPFAKFDLELAAGWLGEALKWMGAGARTASGFGIFETEEARQEAAEAARLARLAAAQAPTVWREGQRVTAYSDPAVVVETTTPGAKTVRVQFEDDDSIDEVPISELRRR